MNLMELFSAELEHILGESVTLDRQEVRGMIYEEILTFSGKRYTAGRSKDAFQEQSTDEISVFERT